MEVSTEESVIDVALVSETMIEEVVFSVLIDTEELSESSVGILVISLADRLALVVSVMKLP